jgi:hypothetical protein
MIQMREDIMDDEKRGVDHVEKAYDVSPIGSDGHPEQDWTAEEEKAVVYVPLSSSLINLMHDIVVKQTGVSSLCCASFSDFRCLIEPTSPLRISRDSQ